MNRMKQLSSHADVAKRIRAELTKHGIPCRVASKSYSGGSSVSVYVTDLPPWTVKEIKAYCSQYQYGHFDGMIDLYEHSNCRDDIPQVKFLFVESNFSDGMQDKAYAFLRDTMHAYKDYPVDYRSAQNMRGCSEWVGQEVWQVLNGSWDSRASAECRKFWQKPHVRAAA